MATAGLSSSDYTEFSNLLSSLSAQSSDLLQTSSSNLASHLPATDDAASQDALLKLKSALLLSYTQHLTLLSSHKLLGFSIDSDENQGRSLVKNLVSTRLALEKIKAVEARLKPRYERCIRAWELEQKRSVLQGSSNGQDGGEESGDAEDIDALSFRPNPSALLASTPAAPSSSKSQRRSSKKDQHSDEDEGSASTGVYKPPKLAPVPYSEEAQQRRRKGRRGEDDGSDDGDDADAGPRGASSRNRRALNAHLLQDMSSSLSSNPYSQSASGLSNNTQNKSKRARKLQEMEDFEEANFTRLVQSKKEQRKRRRDEEDVALGGVTTAGIGSGNNRKVGGGFEEEFGDLLRGSERSSRGSRKEWDDLVSKRKKGGSRLDGPSGNGRGTSKGGFNARSGNRFEKAVKSQGRKSGGR